MLHPLYFEPGSVVRLPEAADHLALRSDAFEVVACFAGGMGICVQLMHRDTGKEFGLKSPRPELVANEHASARFLEELRVWLAASACSGVAEALAVFRLNQMPVVISRWLKGGDWTKTMATMSQHLCFVNLLRVVRTLDWAVAKIGVVHRDLKPANILLDEEGLAYVSDWGLAKPVQALMQDLATNNTEKYQRSSSSHETQHGTFVGTVLYAAPEQILNSAQIDHRADIYSLGCILFEVEMGTPPFIGKDAAEIASQHLYNPIPSLTGSTKLGTGKIIARCLQKNPDGRYQTHNELAQVLQDAAQRQNVDVLRASITTRYKRNIVGHGDASVLPDNAVLSRDGTLAVVEWDEVAPLFDEADNLIGLGRFRDAAKILERFYVPETSDDSDWQRMHTIGCNLACCLSEIEDDQEKALCIFERLSPLREKPANFYINFSLALSRVNRSSEALDVCRRGVRHYPDDLHLLGNLAIALLQTGHKYEAADICVKRISMRRDLGSLQDSAVTLHSIAQDLKWIDLPNAVKYAKLALELTDEGLQLNPQFPSLFLNRANIYRFFNRSDLAADDYKRANDIPWHHAIREIALLRFVEMLEKEKSYESALLLIEKWNSRVSSDDISQDIQAIKMRVIFKQYMLARIEGDYRAVVPEVVEFFRSAKAKDGRPKYPLDVAKVEEWMSRQSDAIAILKATVNTKSDDLDAIQSLAEILSKAGDHEEAAIWAKRLIELAPWKAEAYDLAAHIFTRISNPEAAAAFKMKGDEIFAREAEILKL